MSLYLRLAWRNLGRHKRRTLIVGLSIALALMLMIFYDGLVHGFQDAVYGNAIKVLGGNIQVHAAGYEEDLSANPLLPLSDPAEIGRGLSEQPGVTDVLPRIVTGGMAISPAGGYGVQIVGLDPAEEERASLISKNIVAGRYLFSSDLEAAVVGKGLAETLDLEVGDTFTLTGRSSSDQMSRRTMVLAGIYDLQMPDMEKTMVYITLPQAQEMFDLEGEVTELVVQMEKLGGETEVVSAVASRFPGQYELKTWKQAYPELEAALGKKGEIMDVFGTVMLLVTGIGIFNLLMMAVFERTREIGVLGALGLKPRDISLIFLLEGMLMGAVGAALGILGGVGLNLLLQQTGLDYSQFTGGGSFLALLSSKIYPSLGLERLPQRVLVVLVIALLSALVPARSAARQEPATALHYV